VNQHLNELKLLNRALFDQAGGLPQFGDVPTLLERRIRFQVNDFEIQIVGLFTLGVSFSAEGNLITSDSTFFTPLSQRQANEISVGIVKVESNATIERVQADLRAILPDDLLVLTLDEFAAREREYWKQALHRLYLWLWRSDWVLGRSGNCLSDSLQMFPIICQNTPR